MVANTNEKYKRGKSKKKKTSYTHMNKLCIHQLFTKLSDTTFLIACDDNW